MTPIIPGKYIKPLDEDITDAIKQGNLVMLLEIFTECIQSMPEFYMIIGRTALELYRKQAYRALSQQDPTFSPIEDLLTEKAIPFLSQLNQSQTEIMHLLTENAIPYLLQANQLNPDLMGVYVYLATAYFYLGKNEAKTWVSRGLQKLQNSSSSHYEELQKDLNTLNELIASPN